jgi:4-diphosphocytidyl-2-C-methyl-D-erythritol kinase
MTKRVRLLAPAKLNWTLEVLRRRDDGYHEIRSVMQTIDLCDTVTLIASDGVHLQIDGDAELLANELVDTNLAYRAAMALQALTQKTAGVRIKLEKRIAVAAGLGGGSSDAAAVLRGCNVLWDLRLDDAGLMRIGASIGSDVPFFISGGTASVGGRGEEVRPLRDAVAAEMMLAVPVPSARGEKTAAMYAALSASACSEGEATSALTDVIENGRQIDDAQLTNAFEPVLPTAQPQTEIAMRALRAMGIAAHLAGSGPSLFVLVNAGVDVAALAERAQALGFETHRVRTLTRAAAQRIEEV